MLILAATPIGNFSDASTRLKEWLGSADIIAAEDTRKTYQLANKLGVQISGRVISFYDHNESARIAELIDALQSGLDVVVVSDAGMPMINDPGYKIVQAAIENNLAITCLPGPSAPLSALVLSGLPVHRFCYEGFLPPKSGARINRLKTLQSEERTMVFLESKHRIIKTLQNMLEVFGAERKACICRELTKQHEEILRGSLSELLQIASTRELKGEICIVVAGI
jgi:16S rRNA (cytidine1402-2'-O)-methyltransferase